MAANVRVLLYFKPSILERKPACIAQRHPIVELLEMLEHAMEICQTPSPFGAALKGMHAKPSTWAKPSAFNQNWEDKTSFDGSQLISLPVFLSVPTFNSALEIVDPVVSLA